MLCSDNFEEFFRKNPPSFGSTSSNQMKCLGKTVNYREPKGLDKLFDASAAIEFDLLDWFKSGNGKYTDLSAWIDERLRPELYAEKQKAEALAAAISGDCIFESPDVGYILTTLKPCRIVGHQKKEAGYRFFNTKTNALTEYDYHSVSAILQIEHSKAEVEKFMANCFHIKPVYDPFNVYDHKLIEGSHNIYSINEYVPPPWKDLYADADAVLDEDFKKLFWHLFPDDDSREFVFNWIYHSINSRCGTFLYLCGGQGSGKNTLGSLLGEVHGEENTSQPKKDGFKAKHNFYLKNKRFVFFDEFNCRTREDKDILKSIINNRTQIEGKYRDHEDVTIYASYLLTNNSPSALTLNPEDRRFSVPEISDQNIVEVYGHDWMHDLVLKIADSQRIAEFAKWVNTEFAKPKWVDEVPFQRERFWNIVRLSCRGGLSFTLKKIMAREKHEYRYEEEKASFENLRKRDYYPNNHDWETFLTQFQSDGERIGTVKDDTFTPREDLLPAGFDPKEAL